MIDASHSFVKIGKQNVLQEKDIAKIVDVYVERAEIKGYSHLATREEILKNDYNMNIPRYVEAIEDEIPHDVDGHLLGGIPQKNIDDLTILNKLVPDILANSLKTIRNGYVKVMKPVAELTKDVLNDSRIIAKSNLIEQSANQYIEKYWNNLRKVNKETNLNQVMESMLVEIKANLSEFEDIEVYDGYQIIAEIWKNALTHDTELIAENGFYETGRTREPNMITKGTGKNKREEQDGWIGAIVPNDLIVKRLYGEELKAIEDKKYCVGEIETELSEFVEAAKVEDSVENAALYDAIKKNGDDEPQDSFDSKAVKVELRKATKGTPEYDLIKKVEGLIAEKSSLSKEIKDKEKELKEAVYEKILVLTDEEIDQLVFEKWFGTTVIELVKLVERPIRFELATLEMLIKRYEDNLSEIEAKCNKAEKDLEALMSELVVI